MCEENKIQTVSEADENVNEQDNVSAEDVGAVNVPVHPSFVMQPKNNGKSVKKIIIAVATLFAVGILAVVVLLTVKVFIPNSKYNNAVELEAAGSYDEAIAIFNELGDYKNSPELKAEALLKAKITDAQKLYDSGDKLGAYKMLADERDRERIAEILSGYEKVILEEASVDIYWDEDEMSDYHWAHSSKEDKVWTPEHPFFYIFLSQNKENQSELSIFLHLSFAHGNALSFTTPVHPNSIRIKGDNETIDIPVSLNDRSFTSSDDGYWVEHVTLEITLEKANEISELFANSSDVKIRVSGSSKNQDYTLISTRCQGIEGIVEFINVMYSIYGTEE